MAGKPGGVATVPRAVRTLPSVLAHLEADMQEPDEDGGNPLVKAWLDLYPSVAKALTRANSELGMTYQHGRMKALARGDGRPNGPLTLLMCREVLAKRMMDSGYPAEAIDDLLSVLTFESQP